MQFSHCCLFLHSLLLSQGPHLGPYSLTFTRCSHPPLWTQLSSSCTHDLSAYLSTRYLIPAAFSAYSCKYLTIITHSMLYLRNLSFLKFISGHCYSLKHSRYRLGIIHDSSLFPIPHLQSVTIHHPTTAVFFQSFSFSPSPLPHFRLSSLLTKSSFSSLNPWMSNAFPGLSSQSCPSLVQPLLSCFIALDRQT